MNDKEFSAELAIIGGTGLYELDGFEEIQRRNLVNRWGKPSSEIILVEYNKTRIAFIARHGLQHNIPPHKVNYRANIWALKELGIKEIVSVAAVGGINETMPPETVVIPDQIVDYTYSRKHTYYEDELDTVQHIDFTEPYSKSLRSRLLAISDDLIDGAVYAATQGPRLETAAEILRLKRDGCDIVGMTGMPEAALARELDIDYACCALVVNWAAGCAGTTKIEHPEMLKIVNKGMYRVKSILQKLV